jgi:glucose/arabinose dehydrogenase
MFAPIERISQTVTCKRASQGLASKLRYCIVHCSWKKWLFVLLVCAAVGVNQGCGGADNSSPQSPSPPPGPLPPLALTPVASGFTSPLALVPSNDSTNRLFVVEQRGTIRIIQNGALLAGNFLDISSKVITAGEQGLLGLAFHPQFAANRKFYIYYSQLLNSQRQSVIAEYLTSTANPNQADTTSERILLVINQPNFDNHKGGQLAFGPDGFLYIGLGDGGSGGDPQGNGQSLNTLLGKILRVDVNTTSGSKPYGVPADNPFAGGSAPEIWAYGLRNPWRFSFDSTGRLFCGDVGQGQFEEVDIIQKGGNYGWNVMEGAHCFNPSSGCNQSGKILPITEYDHSEGTAIIGGFVYRGTAISQLQGSYVFGDFTGGKIWRLQETSPGSWTRTVLLSTTRTISSFGQDQTGELYVVDYGAGVVLKLAPQ